MAFLTLLSLASEVSKLVFAFEKSFFLLAEVAAEDYTRSLAVNASKLVALGEASEYCEAANAEYSCMVLFLKSNLLDLI